jgi:hypothetical protein
MFFLLLLFFFLDNKLAEVTTFLELLGMQILVAFFFSFSFLSFFPSSEFGLS